MANPPTRIWIARHGQSEANTKGLFCGQSESPLTELGREQSRALARRLAGVPIRAVYTSDLGRAIETAALALEGRAVTPRVDAGLREIHYGRWEMRRESDIRREDAEQTRLLRDEDPAWQPPGGESLGQVRERIHAALKAIASRHHHEDVLVVSHGTAIACMLAEVVAAAPTHTLRFDFANCALSAVTAGSHGRLYLTLVNDTSHLAGVGAGGPK